MQTAVPLMRRPGLLGGAEEDRTGKDQQSSGLSGWRKNAWNGQPSDRKGERQRGSVNRTVVDVACTEAARERSEAREQSKAKGWLLDLQGWWRTVEGAVEYETRASSNGFARSARAGRDLALYEMCRRGSRNRSDVRVQALQKFRRMGGVRSWTDDYSRVVGMESSLAARGCSSGMASVNGRWSEEGPRGA